MRYLFYLILFMMVPAHLLGQLNPGARQIALSHSDVALSDDVFALFNNSAGLAQLNWREFGIYYSPAPYGLSELANGYAAYVEPTSLGNFAAGFSTFGFELYRETQFSVSYSKRIAELFFAGLTANYKNLKIQNYGSDGLFTFDISSLIYITGFLRAGFSVSNIGRSSFGNEDGQTPTIYASGFSYDIFSDFIINIAIEKEHDRDLSFRSGIEYSIIEYLDLRVGTSNKPNSFSAGLGINYSIFQLDYALFTHQDLGLTHQAGILVHFGLESSRREAVKNHLFN